MSKRKPPAPSTQTWPWPEPAPPGATVLLVIKQMSAEQQPALFPDVELRDRVRAAEARAKRIRDLETEVRQCERRVRNARDVLAQAQAEEDDADAALLAAKDALERAEAQE
jgi:hypothetical protein